jgi:hypothetical protein
MKLRGATGAAVGSVHALCQRGSKIAVVFGIDLPDFRPVEGGSKILCGLAVERAGAQRAGLLRHGERGGVERRLHGRLDRTCAVVVDRASGKADDRNEGERKDDRDVAVPTLRDWFTSPAKHAAASGNAQLGYTAGLLAAACDGACVGVRRQLVSRSFASPVPIALKAETT